MCLIYTVVPLAGGFVAGLFTYMNRWATNEAANEAAKEGGDEERQSLLNAK